jgi:hypothetical protein
MAASAKRVKDLLIPSVSSFVYFVYFAVPTAFSKFKNWNFAFVSCFGFRNSN